jgi:tellurite resistance protein TerC
MTYVFGAFLVYTGVRMAFHRDAEVHPERNRSCGWSAGWCP